MLTDETTRTEAPGGDKPYYTGLPNWIRGRFSAEEIGLMWILQSYYPDIRPSLATVERESGISRRQLYRMLAVLDADGATVRRQRRRQDGGQTSNTYQLRLWADDAAQTIRPQLPPCASESRGPRLGCTPSATVAHPPVPHSHPPRATVAHHEEDKREEEQDLKKENQQPNPPVSPPMNWGDSPQAGPGLGDPAVNGPRRRRKAPQPSTDTPEATQAACWAAQAHLAAVGGHSITPVVEGAGSATAKRSPAVRDPYASKKLPLEAIPADLLDCRDLLAEWWQVKGRGRTRTAFERACAMLRRYDPTERARMLESAVVGGWQGLHEVKPTPGGGNGRLAGYADRDLTPAMRSTLGALAITRGERAGFNDVFGPDVQ